MSGYDHWRSLAFGLSIAFVSASAVAEMTCTALAQDQGTWSAASTMPTGTGYFGVAALDGRSTSLAVRVSTRTLSRRLPIWVRAPGGRPSIMNTTLRRINGANLRQCRSD